jgi:hypothetical protein
VDAVTTPSLIDSAPGNPRLGFLSLLFHYRFVATVVIGLATVAYSFEVHTQAALVARFCAGDANSLGAAASHGTDHYDTRNVVKRRRVVHH